jgi:hypothetical protein
MWELKNRTSFAVGRLITLDKHGERHWVVVVKGTFDIGPQGETSVSAKQVEPEAAPKYRGDPGESSLLYEQDLQSEKPRTDFYVNATAYAPEGREAAEVSVSIKTLGWLKTLTVRGDRRWRSTGLGDSHPSAPLPFKSMPIIYERAYGGFDRIDPEVTKHRLDPHNPVGVGFYTDPAHRTGRLLANIEPEDGKSAHGPAGFGAVCSYWEPRVKLQGTYDARWMDTQKPLLPVDYDPLHLQCAPIDQQMSPHWRGGESIELINLTPSGRLQFELPKHYFVFSTHFGARVLEHRATLSTVILEPDVPRVMMAWTSTLSCHHLIDDLDFTEVVEKEYV